MGHHHRPFPDVEEGQGHWSDPEAGRGLDPDAEGVKGRLHLSDPVGQVEGCLLRADLDAVVNPTDLPRIGIVSM